MTYDCKNCGSRVLDAELSAEGLPVRCSSRLCPHFAIEPTGSDWYETT